jgi:exoribonuclease R
VHIADVSAFVTPDSDLDEEARKRATTVYLTWKNIPMLPRELSEGLCSLHPLVNRLSYSVVWTLDPKGKIINTWFG